MDGSRLSIEECEDNGVFVMVLKGKIDSDSSAGLGTRALALLEKGDMVFDMTGVSYISSAGLRVLTQCHKKAVGGKRRFSLRGVNELVGDVLQVSGMTDLLNIE